MVLDIPGSSIDVQKYLNDWLSKSQPFMLRSRIRPEDLASNLSKAIDGL